MGFAYIFEGVFVFWSYQTPLSLKFKVYLHFVFMFLMVLCFFYDFYLQNICIFNQGTGSRRGRAMCPRWCCSPGGLM